MKLIQPSFSGGEFSPSLWSRVDLQKYATGLKTAINFIIHPHGGASNRPGTRFITAARNPDKKCRLVTFEFSLDQVYVLEFGEHYIRFFKDGALLGTNTEWVSGVTYSVGDRVWHDMYTGLPMGGPPGHQSPTVYPGGIYRCLIANSSTVFADSVLAGEWVLEMYGEGIWSPYLETDLPDLKFTQSADVLYITHPKYPPQMLIRYGDTNWVLETYTFKNGPFMQSNATAARTLTVSAIKSTYSTTINIAQVNVQYSSGIISLVTATPHGLVWGDRVKVADLDGSLDWVLNGQTFCAGVINTTSFYVFYDGTRTSVRDPQRGNGYIPTTGSISTMASFPTITANFSAFDTSTPSKHIGSLWRIRHDLEGQRVTSALASVTQTSGIQCGKTWRLITHGNWDGQIEVQKSLDGGTTWLKVRGFSSSMNGGATGDFNPNTYGDLDEPCQVRVAMTARTAGTCNVDLTTDAYTHTGVVKITAVTSATAATVDVLTTLGAVTATDNWAEGSWSEYRGWPAVAVFYQDRLCFAATNLEPQTIWLSKTGEYNDFGTSDPLVDSDAIGINLPSRKLNGIRNLVALNTILAMTSSSEWSVGPGGDGAITPTSVDQKCQGYRGSSNVTPLVIGNRGLFFQPMGALLRDFAYTMASDGYDGDELTVWASHLFEGHSIVDMAYQQEPDSLVWCVREDGVLLSLTYLKEQEVLAWTQHETDGLIESICSIPGAGYNEVWLVVNRAGKHYIERMARRMASTDVKDQFFVDSGVSYDLVTPSTQFTGLDHLEGKEVIILADGNVVRGKTVSYGGVTLDTAASKVHIGLPYIADFETLNVELNLNTGTTQGAMIKISEVILRFLNSRGGLLGANFSDDPAKMDEINNSRTTEPLGTPIQLKTLDIKKVLASSGYSAGGRICYRQKDPLPVTILAVIPNVQVGA